MAASRTDADEAGHKAVHRRADDDAEENAEAVLPPLMPTAERANRAVEALILIVLTSSNVF